MLKTIKAKDVKVGDFIGPLPDNVYYEVVAVCSEGELISIQLAHDGKRSLHPEQELFISSRGEDAKS